jgi:hypothetical protein
MGTPADEGRVAADDDVIEPLGAAGKRGRATP